MPGQALIQIGLNYRDFPGNWRPAREEIAFARAVGFTSMQFHGSDEGLNAERLGDAPEVVGALLRRLERPRDLRNSGRRRAITS